MATITMPNLDEELKKWTAEFKKPAASWNVILYNDNHNTRDNVILWLQKATGCSLERASEIMITANNTGRAICFGGDKDKCHEVAGYLRGKGLQVEVDSNR